MLLSILCLHGSQQDGEIFSQRIKQLRKKLGSIATLHFVDAPHLLPLDGSQQVPMRTWWRYLNPSNSEQPTSTQSRPTPNVKAMTKDEDNSGVNCASHSLVESEIEGGRPAVCLSWQDMVVNDWEESKRVLLTAWRTRPGGYDGIIGFSNGAAAAFLLATHVLADQSLARSLRFVILCGGYIPQPLSRLLPPDLVDLPTSGNMLRDSLPIPSLHIFSSKDTAVTATASRELAEAFASGSCAILEHDMGHCMPQRSEHTAAIASFLVAFAAQGATAAVTLPTAKPSATMARAPTVLSNGPKVVRDGADKAKMVETSPSVAVSSKGPVVMRGTASRCEAAASVAVVAHEATEEQLEEMEALQAIFMSEYRPISTCPPRFAIHLRDPGEEEREFGAELSWEGPPAHLFLLTFILPKDYPASAIPHIEVEGPLATSDARRRQLTSHIESIAREAVEGTGSGCVYQVVEAAREWINTNLPSNIGQRSGTTPIAPSTPETAPTAAKVEVDDESTEAALPWYEREEADAALIKQAITASLNISFPAQVENGNEDEEASTDTPSNSDGPGLDAELLSGGRWDFVVGLVGKPSAGKSTLFNALTDPLNDDDGAKVGSFPFTTITPNVARAYVAVPDPLHVLGLRGSLCKPTHGFAPGFNTTNVTAKYSNIDALKRWMDSLGWGHSESWRKVPILIKDVAGLVPGAYMGRGRGNAFLNDLCDADVLIHVVDASGSSDAEGKLLRAGEGADPLDDIGWVREEIHRWVYDNVRSKWWTVLRKPSRLAELFSGYHASRALVYAVLRRVGVEPSSLVVEGASLAHWGEAELHRLVATFLAARFPMMLALNKADMSSAAQHIERVRAALPNHPAVAVSAASERWLCAQRRLGNVQYQDASPSARLEEKAQGDERLNSRLDEISERVLRRYGGTGALVALATSLALHPPSLAYPVVDLSTYAALPASACTSGAGAIVGAGQDAKVRALEGRDTSVLRDCIILRPGSTIEHLYWVLKRPPYLLLEGDFVRAEALTMAAAAKLPDLATEQAPKSRVVKKGDVINGDTCIVRIMTNRKVNWQHTTKGE